MDSSFSPPQPPGASKLKLIIALLLFVLLGIACFYVYGQKPAFPQDLPQTADTGSLPSGWSRFSSPSLEFSFAYPPELSCSGGASGKNAFIIGCKDAAGNLLLVMNVPDQGLPFTDEELILSSVYTAFAVRIDKRVFETTRGEGAAKTVSYLVRPLYSEPIEISFYGEGKSDESISKGIALVEKVIETIRPVE